MCVCNLLILMRGVRVCLCSRIPHFLEFLLQVLQVGDHRQPHFVVPPRVDVGVRLLPGRRRAGTLRCRDRPDAGLVLNGGGLRWRGIGYESLPGLWSQNIYGNMLNVISAANHIVIVTSGTAQVYIEKECHLIFNEHNTTYTTSF